MPYYVEDNGLDDKSTVWRFMKFEKFCSMLQTGSLFYASLASFEDPHEAILSQRYYSLRYWSRFKVHFPKRELKDIKLDQNYNRKLIGANCWNCSDVEPEFFWKIYSDLEFGVAIKSNVKRLKSAHSNVSKNIYIRNLVYDELTIQNEKEFKDFHRCSALEKAHFKRPHFAQEKEVRCIINLNEPQRGTLVRSEAIKVNLFDLIEEVVFSPKSPKWFHDVVNEIKSKYGYAQIKSSESTLTF